MADVFRQTLRGELVSLGFVEDAPSRYVFRGTDERLALEVSVDKSHDNNWFGPPASFYVIVVDLHTPLDALLTAARKQADPTWEYDDDPLILRGRLHAPNRSHVPSYEAFAALKDGSDAEKISADLAATALVPLQTLVSMVRQNRVDAAVFGPLPRLLKQNDSTELTWTLWGGLYAGRDKDELLAAIADDERAWQRRMSAEEFDTWRYRKLGYGPLRSIVEGWDYDDNVLTRPFQDDSSTPMTEVN